MSTFSRWTCPLGFVKVGSARQEPVVLDGRACYRVSAWAEDKAPVETGLSAAPGGYTAGQGAYAFCPLLFPAQPVARKSEKLNACHIVFRRAGVRRHLLFWFRVWAVPGVSK